MLIDMLMNMLISDMVGRAMSHNAAMSEQEAPGTALAVRGRHRPRCPAMLRRNRGAHLDDTPGRRPNDRIICACVRMIRTGNGPLGLSSGGPAFVVSVYFQRRFASGFQVAPCGEPARKDSPGTTANVLRSGPKAQLRIKKADGGSISRV